jgi:AcrR family transcriptional regulator
VRFNKQGQLLGRKGVESRQKYLDATLALLEIHPAHHLTVRDIARAAGIASQSFYRYFDDIEEVFLELSAAAGEAMEEVHAALALPWDESTPSEYGQRFIRTFAAYWSRHRPILSVRNYLSDGGHPGFMALRQNAALPVIREIAKRMRIANPGQLTQTEAFARSVIIYSAIERMASRPATVRHGPALVSMDELQRAEGDILTLLFTAGG